MHPSKLILTTIFLSEDFPGGSDGKEFARFYLWVRKIPWRRKWQPTPVILPGEFHGQRSLEGYSPWGCKELNTTERLTPLFLKLLIYLIFGCAVHRLSLVAASGSYSPLRCRGPQASHCSGFFCWGAEALGLWAQ